VLFAAARVLRGTALVRGAARLRGRAGLAARMLLASAPMPVSSGARAPPHDDRSAPSFALLEGCVMRGLFGHVHAATRRALRASGYVEAAAPGQRCCGALHAHAGDAAGARALARANVDAFDRSGARWIAVNSAGCGAALREYPRWLKGVPGLEQRTQRLAARVRDVSELLAAPPRPVRGRLRGRAGYDASCHLLHG
ncbi:MAG: heterodisulfide reductase-related iron-sulfur binding cluster, partial [Gemmatimonadota bacterium]